MPTSRDDPDGNGKNGGWKPIHLLLLGGLGLGGAGTIGVGFEVNSARIEANQDWLARLQAHTLAQDAEITALRRELTAQIEMLRDEMIPRDFRMETVHQFEAPLGPDPTGAECPAGSSDGYPGVGDSRRFREAVDRLSDQHLRRDRRLRHDRVEPLLDLRIHPHPADLPDFRFRVCERHPDLVDRLDLGAEAPQDFVEPFAICQVVAVPATPEQSLVGLVGASEAKTYAFPTRHRSSPT